MTQITWLDPLIYKNRIVHSIRKTPGMTILGFVGQTIRQRLENRAESQTHAHGVGEKGHGKDFLAHFLEIQEANPDYLPAW